MNLEFIEAIDALAKEKHISKDVIFEAIESAVVSAYKKNFGTSHQNVRVEINQSTGEILAFMQMDVVEELEDEETQMTLEEAREIDDRYEIGDIIEFQVNPGDFGRIAAQTARQVVVQRIREAERGMVYDDFISRQGEIVTGKVERISNDTIFVNLGNTEGILSPNEQVKGERYRVNDRIKVYIMDVRKTSKGPQVFLSRSHPGLVKRLFELEVPEIEDGTVVIKGIAREAGSRTKMAVYTEYENVDPVGSCVGTRGTRVQAVVDELNGEKVDIIPWSEDTDELALPLNGFQKKLLSMDFVEAIENTGLSKQMAQRILNRFAPLQKAWFDCIDKSFITETQKIQFKTLISERIDRIKKSF